MNNTTLLEFVKASVGIPFLENGRDKTLGWDCWGLCIAAFRLVGVDLNRYEHIETFDYTKAVQEAEHETKKWVPVPAGQERPWDVVHIRPSHVGVVIGKGKMIHVGDGIGTCIESYNHPHWKHRVLGFYRHGQLS